MRPAEFKKIQKLARLENKEVAERLKVSLSLVEKWRTGKRKITEHMSFVICELIQKKGATR
ncbi:hypothetical protein KAR91_04605 [Candidatus Pacearchaeota archaeon]|nr:hypothetical protein [Candidatus Pacearchaeota archaeon]